MKSKNVFFSLCGIAAILNASYSDSAEAAKRPRKITPTVQWQVTSQSVSEGVGTAQVTAVLSAASSSIVTIPYSLSGTATLLGDYIGPSGSLSIPAGSTSVSVSIQIVDDTIVEPTETLVLSMGTPTGANRGTNAVHTISITDNDVAPLPTVTPAPSPTATSAPSPTPTVTVAPAPTPTATSTAPNLITNPSFESGTTGWNIWENTSVVTGQAQSGSYAIQTGTGAGGFGQMITSKVIAGRSYRLTFYGRANSTSELASVFVKIKDSANLSMVSKQVTINSPTYQQFTLDFTVPYGAASAEVSFWKGTASSFYAYLDNFSLTDLGGATLPAPSPTATATPTPTATIAPAPSPTSTSSTADCPTEATCFYVSSSTGNDAGSGSITSPWKTISKINYRAFTPGTYVLFKRGDIWREMLFPTSGSSSGYITYGAYGSGIKPQLMGSIERNNTADWVYDGNNIWISRNLPKDVGNIVFNNDQSVGRKYWDLIDVKKQGDFWHDPVNQLVKLYSTTNPASYYSDIELVIDGANIALVNTAYVVFKDLWIRNGDYGIQGSGAHHLVVKNNDFSFIGGARLGDRLRAGNAIEFWETGNNILVEGNRIWEVYDTALTHQGAASGMTPQTNIIYRYNVIWNSEYCFEFFSYAGSVVDGIEFSNNTCVDSGMGWGHAQRPDPSGRHVLFWDYRVTGRTVVKNNIFSRSTEYSLYVPTGKNIVFSHNLWQQGLYSPMVQVLTTNYTTANFPKFQSDTGYCATDVVGDPRFVNPAARDYAPALGSAACTASDTGSFIGALPCK